MRLILYGLNHKTASVAVREYASMSEEEKGLFYEDLRNHPDIDGGLVLSTCNRTEFYFSIVNFHKGKLAAKELIAKYCGSSYEKLQAHIYYKKDGDLVRHLFAVASGLDSMVLGETQILGQVQEAYARAKEEGLTNNVINKLFQHAVMTSRLVRNNTFIDRRPVSVSTTAIDLSKRRIKDFANSRVLLIGAGDNSELALKYLLDNGISQIRIINRTYQKALNLANRYKCQAGQLSQLNDFLEDADLVVASTSAPSFVINYDEIKEILDKKDKETVFLDLAVPRDVDDRVGNHNNSYLINLDLINQEVEKNLKKRGIEAEKAKIILHSESRKFIKWKDSLAVVPVIVDLREKAEAIKEKEVDKAFRRLGEVTDRERHIIETMASNIVNTFLHSASENIKDIDVKDGMLSAHVLQKLFELDKQEAGISEEEGILIDDQKAIN